MLFHLTPAKIGSQPSLTVRLGDVVVGWAFEDRRTFHQRWRFSLAPDLQFASETADTLDELLDKVRSLLSEEVRS